jgi:hypothetical protein
MASKPVFREAYLVKRRTERACISFLFAACEIPFTSDKLPAEKIRRDSTV